MQFSTDSVRMVATDSYRLSVKETPVESSLTGTLQAIAPARTLLELSRIAGGAGEETITILPTENQMSFEVGGVTLTSRLIDGQFPNYKQLIPETFDYEVGSTATRCSRPSVVSDCWLRRTPRSGFSSVTTP